MGKAAADRSHEMSLEKRRGEESLKGGQTRFGKYAMGVNDDPEVSRGAAKEKRKNLRMKKPFNFSRRGNHS